MNPPPSAGVDTFPAASATPSAPVRAAGLRFWPGTQLNWLVRYAPLLEHLPAEARVSLLEAGSGHVGVGCLWPFPFVGLEVKLASRPVPNMVPILYGGARFPFQDGAFHTVLSMDALEHVPAAQRPGFLAELVRVAAARVIVGAPTEDPDQLFSGEEVVAALFRAMGRGEPEWLREHDELGLPRARDIEATLASFTGWSYRRIPAANDFVNLLAVLADLVPGADSAVHAVLQRHPAEVATWLGAGTFGTGNRKVYLLEPRKPRPARVDLDRVDTLVAALVCPDCRGEVTVDGLLTCTACGRRFTDDPHGAISMRARPP